MPRSASTLIRSTRRSISSSRCSLDKTN